MSPLSLSVYRLRNHSKYPKGWSLLEKKTLLNHPRCSFCGAKEKLQVHHILPVHLHPELALSVDNLVVLCQSCHLRQGHVSDFQKGYDPQIIARAFENLTRIRILQTDERIKP